MSVLSIKLPLQSCTVVRTSVGKYVAAYHPYTIIIIKRDAKIRLNLSIAISK